MITNAFTPQIYADYKETLQQFHLQMKLTKRKAQRDQIASLPTTTHLHYISHTQGQYETGTLQSPNTDNIITKIQIFVKAQASQPITKIQ